MNSVKAQNTLTTNSVPTIPPEGVDHYKKEIERQNVPITFHGKVVDQDGKALLGAVVVLRVQQGYFDPVYLMKPKYISSELTTDPDGRIFLDNISGRGLDVVSLTQPGFELEPNVRRFFGPVSGSVDTPVIFRMWSTNIHEKLIGAQKSFHILPDGTPYVINLNKGTIAESGEGDLKIWIKYVDHPIRGQTNDWACRIDVIDGGLLEEEHSDSSMYSAPAKGYVPAFQLQQQIKGGQRGSIGTRRFYVMLRNGQEYGRITIELNAPFNDNVPGLIRLEYAINPTGSRVLRP
jgi:hypothetical protein